MKLINILMQEHRIIEKIMDMLGSEIKKISEENHIDPISMYVSIDFIRTGVDQVHHGKEEKILFRELSKKRLLPEHAKIMSELRVEHQYSRGIVGKWMNANQRYFDGEDTSWEITSYLKELIQFYPRHIRKEDEHFFHPILDYFRKEEFIKMMREFEEFDNNVLYRRALVSGITGK